MSTIRSSLHLGGPRGASQLGVEERLVAGLVGCIHISQSLLAHELLASRAQIRNLNKKCVIRLHEEEATYLLVQSFLRFLPIH